MPVVGFTYTKIFVEKKDRLKPEDKIINNVNLVKVEEEKRSFGDGKSLLNFQFQFTVEYGKAGKLELDGSLLYMNDPKEIKAILSEWEKEGKLRTSISAEIFNSILFKCNIKALQLADDLSLPAHFRVPLLRPKQEKPELKKAG